jgi:hypothetical protein
MKKVLITCRSDPSEGAWWELYKLASGTFMEYAKVHGYEYRDFFFEDIDAEKWHGIIRGRTPEWPFKRGRTSPCWLKIPIINMMLDEYDEVLYLDNDCVILDFSKDIAAELPPLKWLAMAECTTGEGTGPNVGVALTRNCVMARKFWQECWTANYWMSAKWTDQGNVFGVLGYNHNPPISKLRSTEYDHGYHMLSDQWNDWAREPGKVHTDTRILHAAWGRDGAWKLSVMQEALKQGKA